MSLFERYPVYRLPVKNFAFYILFDLEHDVSHVAIGLNDIRVWSTYPEWNEILDGVAAQVRINGNEFEFEHGGVRVTTKANRRNTWQWDSIRFHQRRNPMSGAENNDPESFISMTPESFGQLRNFKYFHGYLKRLMQAAQPQPLTNTLGIASNLLVEDYIEVEKDAMVVRIHFGQSILGHYPKSCVELIDGRGRKLVLNGHLQTAVREMDTIVFRKENGAYHNIQPEAIEWEYATNRNMIVCGKQRITTMQLKDKYGNPLENWIAFMPISHARGLEFQAQEEAEARLDPRKRKKDIEKVQLYKTFIFYESSWKVLIRAIEFLDEFNRGNFYGIFH